MDQDLSSGHSVRSSSIRPAQAPEPNLLSSVRGSLSSFHPPQICLGKLGGTLESSGDPHLNFPLIRTLHANNVCNVLMWN